MRGWKAEERSGELFLDKRAKSIQTAELFKLLHLCCMSTSEEFTVDEAAERAGAVPEAIRRWIGDGGARVDRMRYDTDRLNNDDVRALITYKLQVDITRLFDGDEEKVDAWLDTVNVDIGGYTPRELIGTDDEEILRNHVGRMIHGMTS